jgi:hypothetical protein
MLGPMDWPSLDTRLWNLSLGAAAATMLAACGPFVIPEGETDTASVTDTEPTDPDATDTTPDVECYDAGDCQPGEQCIDNICMPYDYYCDDGGCCYDYCCYDDCCYDECYYGCYSDEECGPLGLCEGYGGGCSYPEEIPECDGPEIIPAMLMPGTEDELVSLAFVDANGDASDDLVVGRNGSAELHMGPGLPPVLLPVPPGSALIDAASGDFDGDGDSDLAASTAQGSLLMMTGDGTGVFSLALDLELGVPMRDLAPLQWNGDGTLDLASVSADGQAWVNIGDGAGGFMGNEWLPTSSQVLSLVGTDYGGDAYGDLVVQDDLDPGYVFLGDVSGDLRVDNYLPGTLHGPRRLLAGAMDPGPPYEVVGYTPKPGWMLLELWNAGLDGPWTYGLPSDAQLADMGDFDGDGIADVIMAGPSSIDYIRGAIDPGFAMFSCQSHYFFGAPVGMLAVGDFDGDGRADAAVESFGNPAVLHTF